MKPNRILIVKLSSLGDLFHALPAVHCLREQLDAEIHWVTQTEYAGLVGCFTDVSRIIVYNRRAPIRGFGALWRELRAEKYDLVVDLQGLLKSALIARLARAGRDAPAPASLAGGGSSASRRTENSSFHRWSDTVLTHQSSRTPNSLTAERNFTGT